MLHSLCWYEVYMGLLHSDLPWFRHLDNENICIIECFIISLLPRFSFQNHKSETNSRSTTIINPGKPAMIPVWAYLVHWILSAGIKVENSRKKRSPFLLMNNRQNAWESFSYFWKAFGLWQICKSFWKRNRRRTFNRQIRNMLMKSNSESWKFLVRIISVNIRYCLQYHI